MLEIILERFSYIPIIILMMTGLYVVIATGNLVKRLVGLSLFQTSVFLLYITMGKVFGGQPPIIAGDAHGGDAGHGADAAAGYGAEAAAGHAAETAHHVAEIAYSNPLPHVLILTAPDDRDGRPVEIPKSVRLACFAISSGIDDFNGTESVAAVVPTPDATAHRAAETSSQD